MSTQRDLYEPAGAGVTPNDFADVVDGGDLFIRDLPSNGTRGPALDAQSSAGDEGYDDDDGIVTTMMLGEEGDRGGDKKEKKEKKDKPDDEIVTTMAVGEEGERGGGLAS